MGKKKSKKTVSSIADIHVIENSQNGVKLDVSQTTDSMPPHILESFEMMKKPENFIKQKVQEIMEHERMPIPRWAYLYRKYGMDWENKHAYDIERKEIEYEEKMMKFMAEHRENLKNYYRKHPRHLIIESHREIREEVLREDAIDQWMVKRENFNDSDIDENYSEPEDLDIASKSSDDECDNDRYDIKISLKNNGELSYI